MDDKSLRRAGVIVNPRSGKFNAKGMQLIEKLRADTEISTYVLDSFETLSDCLGRFADEGVTDIFISSGDGTIQAIQTALAETRLFSSQPRLCLLPHGTTNMTAADLGFTHRSVAAQERFIRTLSPGQLRDRPTIRVKNPRDGRARHGMFLGTGAVVEATSFCQKAFNAKGVSGSWATFATLATATLRTVFTRSNADDTTRLDRPHRISVVSDGKTKCEGQQLMLLSTTLQKLILGTRPFWGGASGPIRTTVIPFPVPSIPRWLLPLMYGSEDRDVPNGAVSFSGSRLEIDSSNDYVIDGEFFQGPEHGALEVEAGPIFTYIVG